MYEIELCGGSSPLPTHAVKMRGDWLDIWTDCKRYSLKFVLRCTEHWTGSLHHNWLISTWETILLRGNLCAGRPSLCRQTDWSNPLMNVTKFGDRSFNGLCPTSCWFISINVNIRKPHDKLIKYTNDSVDWQPEKRACKTNVQRRLMNYKKNKLM